MFIVCTLAFFKVKITTHSRNEFYQKFDGDENSFSNLKILLISSLLATFAAFRVNTGADWILYADLFAKADPDSFENSLRTFSQSRSFSVFQYFLKQFTDDVRFLFFLCSFITSSTFLFAIRNFQVKLPTALYIYYCLGYYVLSFNAVRQSVAVSLVFLAMSFKRESLLRFFSLVFLASLFHASALLAGFALFVLDYVKIDRRNIFLMSSFAIGAYLALQTSFVASFVSLFDSRYEQHLRSEAAGIGTLLNLGFKIMFLLALVYLAKNKQDTEFNIYLLSACIVLFLATTSWTIGRMEPYFSIFFTVKASRILGQWSNRTLSSLIYLSLAIYFGFYASFYNGVVPYIGVFSSPF